MSAPDVRTQPLVVFVPVALEEDELNRWRDSIVAQLAGIGVVGDHNRETWAAVLHETGAMDVPEQASGTMLLVSKSTGPMYLWVTMARPAGNPIALGEAVLDTQMPQHVRAESAVEVSTGVSQGYRIGRRVLEDGVEILLQLSVTVSTLKVPGLGDVDVCVWFGTEKLESVDAVLPAVAGLMHDPDLAAYLSA